MTAQVTKRLLVGVQEIAIDLHDLPYYSKTPQEVGLRVRSQAKDGPTRSYRTTIAYVIQHGLRVTLPLHFFLPVDSIVNVLKTLERENQLLLHWPSSSLGYFPEPGIALCAYCVELLPEVRLAASALALHKGSDLGVDIWTLGGFR